MMMMIKTLYKYYTKAIQYVRAWNTPMASAATAACRGVLPELSCAFGSLSGASSNRFALSAREYRAARCNGVSPASQLNYRLTQQSIKPVHRLLRLKRWRKHIPQISVTNNRFHPGQAAVVRYDRTIYYHNPSVDLTLLYMTLHVFIYIYIYNYICHGVRLSRFIKGYLLACLITFHCHKRRKRGPGQSPKWAKLQSGVWSTTYCTLFAIKVVSWTNYLNSQH